MRKNHQLISIVTGFICGAISYWFNNYNNAYAFGFNIYLIMGLSAVISTMGLGLFIKKDLFKIPLYLSSGYVIAALARIFYDILKDASSHNLFPFEIAIILVVVLSSSFVGSTIVNYYVKRSENPLIKVATSGHLLTKLGVNQSGLY